MKTHNFQLLHHSNIVPSRDNVVSSPNRLRNSLEQQNSKLKQQIGQLEDALKKMGVKSPSQISAERPQKMQSILESEQTQKMHPTFRPFELVYGSEKVYDYGSSSRSSAQFDKKDIHKGLGEYASLPPTSQQKKETGTTEQSTRKPLGLHSAMSASMLRQYQRQQKDKENIPDNLLSRESSESKRQSAQDVKKQLYESHFRKNQSEAQLKAINEDKEVMHKVIQQSHSTINILTRPFSSENDSNHTQKIDSKPESRDHQKRHSILEESDPLQKVVVLNSRSEVERQYEMSQTEYILRELDKIKRENLELRNMIVKSTSFRGQGHEETRTIPTYQDDYLQRQHKTTMSPLLLSQLSTVDLKRTDYATLKQPYATIEAQNPLQTLQSSTFDYQKSPLQPQSALIPHLMPSSQTLSHQQSTHQPTTLDHHDHDLSKDMIINRHIQECLECQHAQRQLLKYQKRIHKHVIEELKGQLVFQQIERGNEEVQKVAKGKQQKVTIYQTVRMGNGSKQAQQVKSPVNKGKKTGTKKGRNKSSGLHSSQAYLSSNQFQTIQPREERFRMY
ncbi:hypothetical protein FGO68_gene10374 [Halteria grandinella]|uniref:Uncharacterized protein n=1 Tax=Halteria grandinella TaxID=5974 RepID=A0A8J8T7K4_HALGN|nr:hypothetical protein FGO68_gene10374 [Halteria grandinella]